MFPTSFESLDTLLVYEHEFLAVGWLKMRQPHSPVTRTQQGVLPFGRSAEIMSRIKCTFYWSPWDDHSHN